MAEMDLDTLRRKLAAIPPPREVVVEDVRRMSAAWDALDEGDRGGWAVAMAFLLPGIIEAMERGEPEEAARKVADATLGEPGANHWEMSPGRRPLLTDEEGEPPTGEEGYALIEGEGDEEYLAWTPFKGGAELLVKRHNELAHARERIPGERDDARRSLAREQERLRFLQDKLAVARGETGQISWAFPLG